MRECARRFLAGESTRSICAALNERGVPTATGKRWAPQTVTRMLRNPRLSGQRAYKGAIVADAVWPALISREDGERIRTKLADPSRRTNKSARRYLLVRLLKCWYCGEYLVAAPRGDGTRRYGCRKAPGPSGCGKTFINAEPLEQFVTFACLARLNSRELAEAARAQADQPEAERWQHEADTAQAKLDELALAWSADEITRDEWRVARTALEDRLTAARKQLSKITRTTVLDGLIGNADLVQAAWDIARPHPTARDPASDTRPRRGRTRTPWLQRPAGRVALAPGLPSLIGKPEQLRDLRQRLPVIDLERDAVPPTPVVGPSAGPRHQIVRPTAPSRPAGHATPPCSTTTTPALEQRPSAATRSRSPSADGAVTLDLLGLEPLRNVIPMQPHRPPLILRVAPDIPGQMARRQPRLSPRARPDREAAQQLDVHEPAAPRLLDQPPRHVAADREVDVQAVAARVPLRHPRIRDPPLTDTAPNSPEELRDVDAQLRRTRGNQRPHRSASRADSGRSPSSSDAASPAPAAPPPPRPARHSEDPPRAAPAAAPTDSRRPPRPPGTATTPTTAQHAVSSKRLCGPARTDSLRTATSPRPSSPPNPPGTPPGRA